ncbi:hypothetical protein RSA30_21950 [Pantoea stewartii]|nr:hypothetical protein RSA30_21950 [Pantoea stewartii]
MNIATEVAGAGWPFLPGFTRDFVPRWIPIAFSAKALIIATFLCITSGIHSNGHAEKAALSLEGCAKSRGHIQVRVE